MYFSKTGFKIQKFSVKEMHLKNVVCEMAAILSQCQCVNLTDVSSERKYE